MRTYCLACRINTNNVGSRKTTMINEAIRDKTDMCYKKSRFMKLHYNKKCFQ